MYMPTSKLGVFFLLSGHSVMSDSLWLHEPQHARPPCPSPSPGACSDPCPLSRWCHSTISSSVVPFSSRLQSFPASGSFLMSQLFTSGGQSIEAAVSTLVLLMNIQGWFILGWTGCIQGMLKSLLHHHSSKASILRHSAFFMIMLKESFLSLPLFFLLQTHPRAQMNQEENKWRACLHSKVKH